MNHRRLLILIPLLLLFVAASEKQTPNPLNTRDAQFKLFHDSLPEDRLYAQTDKPFYMPGDTVWFSAFVRDARSFKPSLRSDIVYAELLNPKGSIEKSITLVAKNGCAPGDFIIGEDAPGGMYSLKVYTSWQKNDPDPTFFIKELQVQDVVMPRLKMKLDFTKKAYGPADNVTAVVQFETNENKPLADHPVLYTVSIGGISILSPSAKLDKQGKVALTFTLPSKLESSDGLLLVNLEYEGQTESISRSIPIVRNKIELSFFPEGGDLVSGIESQVAFKAANEFGKGADIDGYIKDNTGKSIANFSSLHMGMGGFSFVPEEGKSYNAHITRPKGVSESYPLPEAMPQGYVLSVKSISRATMELSIGATRSEKMGLFVQIRGKQYYYKTHEVKKGSNPVKINLSAFPSGVAQITLIDAKEIERAERLVYVNKHRNASVKLTTDKESYLPREKVKLTITAADESGMGMPGHFALAVTDDQLLTFADDKSSTILSWMLAEADVKGKIEEPRFYFDKKEEKADKALDYLLLTHGWRRFTWEQITGDEFPGVRFSSEKAVIEGTVKIAETGKPAAGATVRILESGSATKADSSGYFTFKNIDLYEPKTVEAQQGTLKATVTVTSYSDKLEILLGNEFRLLRGELDDMVLPMAAPAPEMVNRPAGARRNGHAAVKVPVAMEPKRKALKAGGNGGRRNGKGIGDDAGYVAEVKEGAAFANKPAQQQPALAKRLAAPAMMDMIANEAEFMPPPPPVPEVSYYRSRQFAFPDYKEKQSDVKRSDFRSTLFWQGDVTLKNNGTATVEFFTNDAMTSFRATSEGFTDDGGVARGESVFYSQKPFSLSAKMPTVLVTGDTVDVQVVIKNTTAAKLTGKLSVILPHGLSLLNKLPEGAIIDGAKTATLSVPLIVTAPSDSSKIEISFSGDGCADAVTLPIKIVSQGFPCELSFSGNELSREYSVSIVNSVKYSLSARLAAYPSAVSDLLAGIESILQEPYGCFEQTSMTSYPNALVLSFLKTTESGNNDLVARAEGLLDRGYKRLVTFETKDKGYEWFGQQPPHEALTAYGLMQFADIAKAGGAIDKAMVDRTTDWLMKRRDNTGGFLRNPQALDSYGGADQEITNAYIVYALAEAGKRDIQKELEASVEVARKSGDPYVVGLVANALYCFSDNKRAHELVQGMLGKQAVDGSWCGLKHSITRSEGISLKIETTSLICLAIIKSKQLGAAQLTAGVKFIVASRSGSGAFGATQSTVMALKALTAYAQFARKTDAPGTIVVSVNNKDVARKAYVAGEKNAIIIDSLEKHLGDGDQKIRVRYESTKSPLPYALSVNYSTWKPASSDVCKVTLATTAAASRVKVGQTVRVTAKLKNNTETGLPMTMMIIGLPAGISAQPWQLKELQEKKVVDFYETSGTSVVFYYRQMKPGEERVINLDCKAEVPGRYAAPASRAYLYYTNEHKVWTDLPRMTVEK